MVSAAESSIWRCTKHNWEKWSTKTVQYFLVSNPFNWAKKPPLLIPFGWLRLSPLAWWWQRFCEKMMPTLCCTKVAWSLCQIDMQCIWGAWILTISWVPCHWGQAASAFGRRGGPNGSAIASIQLGHQRQQGWRLHPQKSVAVDQKMRGPGWIDLSGAAVLSGGSSTLDVWIILLFLLTLSQINCFLSPRWKSFSATNFSGVILVFSLRSSHPGTWRTVCL